MHNTHCLPFLTLKFSQAYYRSGTIFWTAINTSFSGSNLDTGKSFKLLTKRQHFSLNIRRYTSYILVCFTTDSVKDRCRKCFTYFVKVVIFLTTSKNQPPTKECSFIFVSPNVSSFFSQASFVWCHHIRAFLSSILYIVLQHNINYRRLHDKQALMALR